MATVKKMKKAQEGAGVPKGKVQGEMTGKMYDKKPFMARKDSASADLQKAIGPKTKPLSSKEQAKEALKALANKKFSVKKKMKDGGSLKPVDAGKNPGLSKLPKPVRNKMGYQKDGGKSKAKAGVSVKKKAMGGAKMMMSGGKCKYGC